MLVVEVKQSRSHCPLCFQHLRKEFHTIEFNQLLKRYVTGTVAKYNNTYKTEVQQQGAHTTKEGHTRWHTWGTLFAMASAVASRTCPSE
eukprot:m.184988 g.184988  ORF g.184988 m.184988 type:complete len:89 (+) comp16678_c0_seq1:1798-2064(+)